MKTLTRRRALSTAGAAAALLPLKARATFLRQSSARTPRQSNLRQGLQSVSAINRAGALTGDQANAYSVVNGVAQTYNQACAFVSPSNVSLSAIQVGFPGFAVDTAVEVIPSLGTTHKYAIEYPIGGTLWSVRGDDGSTSLVVPPGQKNVFSNPVPGLVLPPGSQYRVRELSTITGFAMPSFTLVISGGALSSITGNAISSIIWAAGLLTVITGTPHQYPVGTYFPVVLAGGTVTGTYEAFSSGSATFTIPMAANPGAIGTVGTWWCPGQGLQSVPALVMSLFGSGTGGAISANFQFSVADRITITDPTTALLYSGSTAPTVTSSGGGGTSQPNWQAVINNGWLVDLKKTTPGTPDFTSAPTISISGGNGAPPAISLNLQGGALSSLPTISTGGSGYTNGSYQIFPGSWTGGMNMLSGPALLARAAASEYYTRAGYGAANPADNTPFVGVDSASSASTISFPPLVRGVPSSPTACVGVVGHSLAAGYQDVPNAAGVVGYLSRSLSGEGVNGGTGGVTSGVPFISVARGSQSIVALLGSGRGQMNTLIDMGATHIWINHLSNDISNNLSLTQCQAIVTQLWSYFSGLGLPIYQETVSPRSTSTDGWATLAGQTLWAHDAIRQQVNSWLRAGAGGALAKFGVTLVDTAAVVESGGAAAPSGLWNVTGASGAGAGLLATMTGSAVSGVSIANVANEVPTQVGYLNGASGTLPLIFYGGGGSGAAGTATVTSGVITGCTITSGGSYTGTPLVTVAGAITQDGTHLSPYGNMQLVLSGLITPTMFSL